MKLLKPLRTLAGFQKAFDNGGHFWSIWSRASDGVITIGEISKAGPSLIADRSAILYFELLRGFLPAAEAEGALAALDKKALTRWKKHQPTRCSPAAALLAPPGTAVIVESEPSRASDVEGHGISFAQPVMIGKVMINVATPIVPHFQLWRLDGGKGSNRSTLLAVRPKKLDLLDRRFAIGALVHESFAKPPTGKSKLRCLMGVAACAV